MSEGDRFAQAASAPPRAAAPESERRGRSLEAGVETELFGGRVRLLALEQHVDARGALLPLDFARLPLVPCRAFVVHGVPRDVRRGGHAHRRGRQLLVRLSGRIAVELRWQGERARVELASSDRALLVGAGIWARQTYHGPGARLLVLADQPYDPGAYVLDR